MNLNPERLERVLAAPLLSGAHSDQSGMCVMEAVAYVAGEPWSDQPLCACPVIAGFLRKWNDDLPSDEVRTRLLAPLIADLVGSRSTPSVELKRSYLALDWMVRVMTPAWLELAGLKDQADLIRDLGELRDQASCELATEQVRTAGKKADAARDAAGAAAGAAAWAAAWDAAWDAAGAAAWDAARAAAGAAAWDAARAAAWAAARDAARAAAGAAAWAAARAAAGAAAWDAAWDAARDALQPTVDQLQASALDLVRLMLAVQEPS